MVVKGNLIGFRTAKSQKGNDCFFGYIASEDLQDKNLDGMKATIINAFGADATAIYKKVCEKKMLDKDVAVNGYYNNNNFYAVTIDLITGPDPDKFIIVFDYKDGITVYKA